MYSKFKSLLLYTCRIEGLVSNFRSPDKIASHKNCHCGSSNLIPRTLILTHSAFHMPPMMHKILDKITTFLINHPQQRICVAEGNRPLLISVEGFPPRVIPSWLDTNNITFLRLFYDQNSSLLCFFWIGYCGWAQGETKTGTGTLAGSTTIEWILNRWPVTQQTMKWAGAILFGFEAWALLSFYWNGLLSMIHAENVSNSRRPGQFYAKGTDLYTVQRLGWMVPQHPLPGMIMGPMMPKWIAKKRVLCRKELFLY